MDISLILSINDNPKLYKTNISNDYYLKTKLQCWLRFTRRKTNNHNPAETSFCYEIDDLFIYSFTTRLHHLFE